MPGRSCGSKTLPRSRHRATGTPSGPDQRGERHGSRIHTAHRNGVNPTAARYQEEKSQGALGQLALQAMRFLTVVLGFPGTIRFATGLAHLRAPSLWVKQVWDTTKGIIA